MYKTRTASCLLYYKCYPCEIQKRGIVAEEGKHSSHLVTPCKTTYWGIAVRPKAWKSKELSTNCWNVPNHIILTPFTHLVIDTDMVTTPYSFCVQDYTTAHLDMTGRPGHQALMDLELRALPLLVASFKDSCRPNDSRLATLYFWSLYIVMFCPIRQVTSHRGNFAMASVTLTWQHEHFLVFGSENCNLLRSLQEWIELMCFYMKLKVQGRFTYM